MIPYSRKENGSSRTSKHRGQWTHTEHFVRLKSPQKLVSYCVQTGAKQFGWTTTRGLTKYITICQRFLNGPIITQLDQVFPKLNHITDKISSIHLSHERKQQDIDAAILANDQAWVYENGTLTQNCGNYRSGWSLRHDRTNGNFFLLAVTRKHWRPIFAATKWFRYGIRSPGSKNMLSRFNLRCIDGADEIDINPFILTGLRSRFTAIYTYEDWGHPQK